jgi:DNA polymerase III epsilon subunit-like protein
MTKSRKFCVLYTETNGLHATNEDVCKKNLFEFARLVALNYEIGYRENNKFVCTKKVRSIIKPRAMFITEESIKIHNITMEEANKNGLEIESVLENFLKDLSDVSILISHNIEFHLKTLMAEYVRYNKPFNFNNLIIIDTISFYHNIQYPRLNTLFNSLFEKKKPVSNIEMIKQCFLKLYSDYENSIK